MVSDIECSLISCGHSTVVALAGVLKWVVVLICIWSTTKGMYLFVWPLSIFFLFFPLLLQTDCFAVPLYYRIYKVPTSVGSRVRFIEVKDLVFKLVVRMSRLPDIERGFQFRTVCSVPIQCLFSIWNKWNERSLIFNKYSVATSISRQLASCSYVRGQKERSSG